MTTDPFWTGPDEAPEWATAVPEAPRASSQQRREIAGGVLLVLAGIGLWILVPAWPSRDSIDG
ncbi:hypothetical protein [Aeromicrobium alkaliterrae]|uniref:Uncharacterized protein n=1 Tax=Aeromicrobium alkaliterrae TaxID=302168 RepID=A0ABP4VPJ5_9ACTN